MKSKILRLGLLLLAACSQDARENAVDTVSNETAATWNKVREYTGYAKAPPKEEKTQPRYCYKTLANVDCYPTPIPGQEYRLSGYQDVSGKTGYVLPPSGTPEPESSFKSLPALKSVNVNAPPAVAGTTTLPQPHLKEIIFDPAELQPKTLVPDKEQ